MDNLLKRLNNQRPTIRFTVEREDSNSSLPFLDTLLTRRQDGGLNIAVYRKPSHTDRYLQYSSHHPAHVRRGVASCLFRRARTIPTGDNVRLEEEHLRRVLKANGFPAYIIDQTARQKKRVTPLEEKEENKHCLCLPYIAGLGEDLGRICKKKYNIRLQTGDLEWYATSPAVVVWSTLGKQRGPWRQESVSTRQLSEEERQKNKRLPITHGLTSIT